MNPREFSDPRTTRCQLFLNEEGCLRSGWKALAFLGALGVLEGILFLLLGSVPGAQSLLRGPWGETVPALAALAVSWAALRLERRPLASLGFRLDSRWALELGVGLLLGVFLMGFSALLLRAAGGFVWAINPAASGRAMLTGAGFYLLVAITEETTFRGYPFQRLVSGLGPWGAQLLLATYFAYAHWDNPDIQSAAPALKAVTTLNIALAAGLLGLAWLRTGSLAIPIGIHWAWNWTQGQVLGFAVSGTGLPVAPLKPLLGARPDWLTGGAVGLEGSVCCTLACLGCILGLGLWGGSAQREV